MTDEFIAEEIVKLLKSAKSVEYVLSLVKDTYCLKCGSDSCCGFCDWDSVLED